MRPERFAGAVKDVAAIFGLHVWPFIPSGVLASRAGPIMGACQQFEVRITGVGGHAAMPHSTVDPIIAAANTISSLQVPAAAPTQVAKASKVIINLASLTGICPCIPAVADLLKHMLSTTSDVQALVSRETSPLGTAVVSVTKIAAGEGAYNVIPDRATFGGTLRSLSHDHLMYLKQRFEEVTCDF